ncbi:TPA: KlcA, partial [Klebsiella pneumoniae]|nr:KlcA [Klebsiella pneumoniae]
MQGCADAAILARSQVFYDARRSSRRFLAQVSLENRPDQLRAISALRPPVS